jgi:RNA polymerase sigma-70 factor, ECF subfamily
MEDTELMIRVRSGDETAFREIVERHQKPVMDLCFRFTGNQCDAEEVAMDVFLQLYKIRDTYRPEAKLSTFLYRIAVNRSLNKIRDRKRRKTMSFDGLNKDRPMDPESPASDRPDALMEERERENLVRKALDALPEKQRTALILRRYEELSYTEIAAAMNTSVPAVESLLFRARETLRNSLKPLME